MSIMHGRTPVTEIVLHQSTTDPDWMEGKPLIDKVAEIRSWHLKRGWKDIGYHWIVDRDGSVAPGRAEDVVGAHVGGHNTGRLGICLLGGRGANKNDEFARHFTPQQDSAARDLIDSIKTRANIKRVRGHSEFANRACPGFSVKKFMKAARAPREYVVESTTVQASGLQIASGLGGAAAAISGMSGTAQTIAVTFCCFMVITGAWIMRERIIKWAEGVK